MPAQIEPAAKSEATENPLTEFHWSPQPQAEKLAREWVDLFLSKSPAAASLRARMRDETGTRLFDWIDSLFVSDSEENRRRLSAAGFKEELEPAKTNVNTSWPHSSSMPAPVTFPLTVFSILAACFRELFCTVHL